MGTTGENALTEIGLALAMAFFSIMILTMVSMSVQKIPPILEKTSHEAPQKKGVKFTALNPKDTTDSKNDKEPLIVFYHKGHFMDQKLNTVNPATLKTDESQPIILALAPALSLEQVLKARQKFNRPDITITRMSAEWLTYLTKEKP